MPPLEFSSLTVLVVDDEKFARATLGGQLHKMGVGTVLECASGAEAIALLRQLTPDLVLCDVRMAPVDGLEVLRFIRQGSGGADPAIPMVLVTSDGDQSTVMAAMTLDVDGYLLKPVALKDLQSKIGAVLGKRLANKELP